VQASLLAASIDRQQTYASCGMAFSQRA